MRTVSFWTLSIMLITTSSATLRVTNASSASAVTGEREQ